MDSQPNTVLIDSTSAYYEKCRQGMLAELPDTDWPLFDDLSLDQRRAWMLATAATMEVAVRMADALACMTP